MGTEIRENILVGVEWNNDENVNGDGDGDGDRELFLGTEWTPFHRWISRANSYLSSPLPFLFRILPLNFKI